MRRIISIILFCVIVAGHLYSIKLIYNNELYKEYVEEKKYAYVNEDRRVKLYLNDKVDFDKEFSMYCCGEGYFIYYPHKNMDTTSTRLLVINETDEFCTVIIEAFDKEDKIMFRPSKNVGDTDLEYELDKTNFIGKEARIGFRGLENVRLVTFDKKEVSRMVESSNEAIKAIAPLVLSLACYVYATLKK